MITIRTHYIKFGDSIGKLGLGVAGENNVTRLCVDCADVLRDWPEVSVAALIRRPDGHTYPIGVSKTPNAEKFVEFMITSTETAVSGDGMLQLIAAQEDGAVVRKTTTIPFWIYKSINGAGEPPEAPVPGWALEIAEDARYIKEALEALSSGEVIGVPGPPGPPGPKGDKGDPADISVIDGGLIEF